MQSHREIGPEIFSDPEIESCSPGEATVGGSWNAREADILRDIACAKEEIRSCNTLGLSNSYAIKELERLVTRLEDVRNDFEILNGEPPADIIQELESEEW